MPRLKALTLVELTVSIAITVMLTALSIPLFKNERGDNLALKEAELVASYIESARSMAQHPDNENAVKYTVISDTLGNKLSIKRYVVKPGQAGVEEPVSTKMPLTLSRSKAVIPGTGLDFYTLSGEYRDSPVTIRVVLDSNSRINKGIAISKPGVINVTQ